MANHKSADKRIRQTKVKTERNRVGRSQSRNLIKAVRSAIEAGDKAKASELLVKTQSRLARSAKSGALNKAKASRTTSRLAKQINAL